MVEIKYTFTQEAYCKLIFHANKYLTQQICGLVIGQTTNPKQSKSDSKLKEEQTTSTDYKHFRAIDCIPLFHGHILAPFLEAALAEVERYCEQKGYRILGAYLASEAYETATMNYNGPQKTLQLVGPGIGGLSAIKTVTEAIYNKYGTSTLFMVDNSKVTDKNKLDDLAFVPYTFHVGNKVWNLATSNVVELEVESQTAVMQLLQDYLSKELHWNLFDFGDHLDDLTKDWLNPKLF